MIGVGGQHSSSSFHTDLEQAVEQCHTALVGVMQDMYLFLATVCDKKKDKRP